MRARGVGSWLVVEDGEKLGVRVGNKFCVGILVKVGRGVKVEVEVGVAVRVIVGVKVGVCNKRRIRPGKLQLNSEIHVRRKMRLKAHNTDGIIGDALRMIGLLYK